jgi:tetratricopeptide (TPR) repeat protein
MALAEGRRWADALPALEAVVAAGPTRVDAFYYLGRCHLGLDRHREAAAAFERALELAADDPADERRLESIHYQLALALRRQGKEVDAARHFAAAERYSTALTEEAREDLARYLRDEPAPEAGMGPPPPIADSGLAGLPTAERRALRRQLETSLARCYLNLGVLAARSAWLPEPARFARAIPLLEEAAAIDAGFPGVQKALGVTRFNAGEFAAATAPLAAAAADDPEDADLRRTLALAWLNAGEYARAAELLVADARHSADPGLLYAYGMALVRSERPAEAEAVFARLLDEHADWPELQVLLGQAYAQQGDFPAAINALHRALELAPGVEDARATLASIYLRQGRLAEAEEELHAALGGDPEDVESRYLLATVLSLDRREDVAVDMLRSLLDEVPGHSDARYLLGKLLLAAGEAEAAAAQLEAAAGLAPAEANVRYQLGQAYQKLGRAELAREQFEAFRELKAKERGGPH